MSQRKTLGTNIGSGGGMLAALGFTAPPAPQPPEAPEPAQALPAPEPAAPRPPRRRPSPVEPEAPESALLPGSPARIGTNISVESLDLARRAAHWNRETLRSFLENAIEAAARRIEKDLGLTSLPAVPPQRPRLPSRR